MRYLGEITEKRGFPKIFTRTGTRKVTGLFQGIAGGPTQ
jgi:hypothetical protein